MVKPQVPLGRGPRPRLSEEEVAAVANETRAMPEFARPTSTAAPPAAAKVESPVAQEDLSENLRIPVSKKIWNELTRTAFERGVTVRYLCMEALAKAGYDVDMSKVPADGRRIKKKGA